MRIFGKQDIIFRVSVKNSRFKKWNAIYRIKKELKAMNKVKEKKVIKDIGELIKKKFRAKEVILFGSHAYGKPSVSSDLDILVIMETKLKSYKQAVLIRMYLDENLQEKIPMDLIVRTPKQIKSRLELGDFFMRKIVKDGVYL